MKKYDLILIDGYNFVFRAYYIHSKLTNPFGVPIGGVYGFTNMLVKIISNFSPSELAVAFDSGGKNFRHEIYPEYKAHRPDVDDALKLQLPLARDVVDALNIKSFEMKGYEADDLIASITLKYKKDGKSVLVISPDKDLMQLVSDSTTLYDPVKDKFYQREEVIEKFGVLPEQIRDYLAIVGDRADNIPGIKGIGEKGAIEILKLTANLKEAIELAEKKLKPKTAKLISANKDNALISYALAGLKENLEIDDADSSIWQPPSPEKIMSFIQYHGFYSLKTRIEKIFGYSTTQQKTVNIIESTDQLKAIISKAYDSGYLGLLFWQKANKLSAIEIAYNDEKGHCIEDVESTWWRQDLLEAIKNPEIIKITYDLKGLLHILNIVNIDMSSIEDIMLMHYASNAGMNHNVSFLSIAQKILHKPLNSDIGCVVNVIFRCYEYLKQELFQKKSMGIYYEIDLKFAYLLHSIEKQGVIVDKTVLLGLKAQYQEKLKIIEKSIFQEIGYEFNIGSPKQLGEALFVSLGIAGGKTSKKTGHYKTDAEVLETLQMRGLPVAEKLLEYRGLSKLVSTYTDSLIKVIDKNSRIHTTFSQVSTSTGRLSSHNPNLQNIPIRTKEGIKIRQAFCSKEGYVLASFDYSQIELRILSHIANVKNLKEAFIERKDIHRKTASQIFGMSEEEVTPEKRRYAKAINFGIIYGMSAFGLSKHLKITNHEANLYIKQYFNQYPEIKEYMEKIEEFVKTNGYVQTLYDRRCYIEYGAIRAAINAPIQGTNADIMKMAMNKIYKELNKDNAKIILQIHDEVVLEVKEEAIDAVAIQVKNIMENIAQLTVPLVVDYSYGKNWYDAKKQ